MSKSCSSSPCLGPATSSPVPGPLCPCPHTGRCPSLAVPQSCHLLPPGSFLCYFIKAIQPHGQVCSCQDRARAVWTMTLPRSRCFPKGKTTGKVPGQPREGGRGSWHQPAQADPAAALEKHFLSFLQDFCRFPAKRPPDAGSQDFRALNPTRGASSGVPQGGWRWLLSQIPTLTSVLAQGAHLKVASKWDRPASSELCGDSQFPARGFWEKNILCGSTALLLNASLASQVL